jgi:hypothetical protein
MAVQKINYPAKSRGDLWQASEANELKQVINNNADELSGVKQSVADWFGQPPLTPKEAETATTKLITPNVLHVWADPVASLAITFDDEVAGMMNEYMMEFTVGSASFTLGLPNGVIWGEEPDWQQGYRYWVSISDNLAIAYGWELPAAQVTNE